MTVGTGEQVAEGVFEPAVLTVYTHRGDAMVANRPWLRFASSSWWVWLLVNTWQHTWLWHRLWSFLKSCTTGLHKSWDYFHVVWLPLHVRAREKSSGYPLLKANKQTGAEKKARAQQGASGSKERLRCTVPQMLWLQAGQKHWLIGAGKYTATSPRVKELSGTRLCFIPTCQHPILSFGLMGKQSCEMLALCQD